MKIKLLALFVCLLITTRIFPDKAIYSYPNQFDLNLIRTMEQKQTVPEKPNITERTEPYTIFLKYSDPQKTKDALKTLYPDILMATDERTRAILLNTTPKNFKTISDIARKLDFKLPQIKIEVQIIEISYSDFDQYKNMFSNLTDGFSVNFDFKENKVIPSDFEGILSMMIKNGHAKVLAKPTVTTLDNHRSIIHVGDRIPYLSSIVEKDTVSSQVTYLDTGIELEILPQITSSNSVLSEISASISNVKIWKEYKESTYPILSSRTTRTRVNIENKKTLVIAGLINEENQTNTTKAPFLADLAWIGDIFKSRTEEKVQSDIVFLITPEIF